MKQVISPLLKISLATIGCLLPISEITYAQVISDGTVNTQVDQNGNVLEITGGETRDTNLFHSFQEFSVDSRQEASFQNAPTIENIFSRVTGLNPSLIDGIISANGTANLFLLNPAGIIFGPEATLNISGSFIGTTADSIQFSDGTVFSATDTQTQPVLTINAPIGLNFRDNPGDIINQSVVTDETGNDLIGLRVLPDETLALIGGDVFIEEGFVSTVGGRIELGSVADNSTVQLSPVEQGFDVSYEEVTNFQDISLSGAALVTNFGLNPGDIEVQGRNISLTEGSGIGITAQTEGEAGNVNVIASESLSLDGNGLELLGFNLPTLIFSIVNDEATGEANSININTNKLTITNGGQITTNNDIGSGQGVDINIEAVEVNLGGPFLFEEGGAISSGILAQVFERGTGDGGDISIKTTTLTVQEGAQISTDTFGPGNGGDLTVNASESIELNGTVPDIEDNTPSALFANVGVPFFQIPTAGNGGNITITTPKLIVKDGAQIGTTARNTGNGGILTITATESIFLSNTSPSAEFRGEGISGIFVSAEQSFEDPDTGARVPTTGKGGTLELTTPSLIIEKGAAISADTFSLGDAGNATINVNNLIVREGGEIRAGSLIGAIPLEQQRGSGGELTINASDSIEVTGTGNIGDTLVNSSILTLAESNGNAGNLTINTQELTVNDGGNINTSATGTSAAGTLTVNAESIALKQGELTATTAAVRGGNIELDIEDKITLRNESRISAEATIGQANGGNVNINSKFIIAYPSQPDGNDILASAVGGDGGNIAITAESLLNIEERKASLNNGTNDIDATSNSGVDGTVEINSPDNNNLQGQIQLSSNVIEQEQTVAQACQSARFADKPSGLTVKGKGGIPSLPTEPLNSENILVEEEVTPSNIQTNYPKIKPIKTSIGDIYPARGVIKTVDGQIILTAYATDNLNNRTPHILANCR